MTLFHPYEARHPAGLFPVHTTHLRGGEQRMTNYRLTFEVDADGPVSSRRLSDLYREMHKYAETVLMPKGGELSSRYNATIIDFTELDGSNATFPVHQHDGGVENDYCAYCDSMSRDQRD